MLTFSHALLAARDLRELARYRNYLLTLRTDVLTVAQILHRPDAACCRREPWGETEAAIIGAVRPDDIVSVLELDLTDGGLPERRHVH